MKKNNIIILFSLLFYILMIFYIWHPRWHWKANVPLSFSILFYSLFMLVMFLSQSAYLLKVRHFFSSFLFGAFTGALLGLICWVCALLIFSDLREMLFNSWEREATVWQFLMWQLTTSSIITAHFLIGALSTLTSTILINKFSHE